MTGTSSQEPGQSSGIFYGWFVVGACFMITLTLGETFWSFGVFFKSLEDEFGWSRTVVSSGYTAFLLGHALSLVVSGRLADRYNPRPILLCTAVVASAGIALCGSIQDVTQFRVFLFVAGLGAGPIWAIPNATVQRWFYGRKRAGLALAITTTGVGVGALIFAPLINQFIMSFGWRSAFHYVGISFFVILLLSALLVRKPPTLPETIEKPLPAVYSLNLGRVITRPSFLGITMVVTISIVSFQAMSVHLTPFARDAGISAGSAAAALGLIGGFSIPGRLLSGVISQNIGWQKTLTLALLGTAGAVTWLVFTGSTWMLYVFVFFYGLGHGIRIPAQMGILNEFFGMKSLGQLIGLTTAVGQLIGSLAPYMAGFVFDRTGSYTAFFALIISLLLAAAIVAFRLKEDPDIVEGTALMGDAGSAGNQVR